MSNMNYTLLTRHPGYVMMSSDYSQQEPKLTAFCSSEPTMIKTFQDGKDIYATIASIAFSVPYERCLEFHPDTHEYQADGAERRSTAKVIVLGINYGMSPESIGQELYAGDDSMSDEDKTKKANQIFDAVMKGFPDLSKAIQAAQAKARKLGYTETMLGRRRHHPDMQLPRFEITPMKGYVSPDVDPLDPSTLTNKDEIPERIVNAILKDLNKCKYYGQIVKIIKKCAEEKIKVVNNTSKIQEASRKVWNAVIQGSAADLTKLAMLKLHRDPEWNKIHGRILVPVHDELICEVPFEYRAEGEAALKRCMEGAGSFLPFKIYCDVATTFRWYGVSVDTLLGHTKPVEGCELTEDNIEWIQAMMCENEYILPVFKNPDGSKPKGDPGIGINGVWTEELESMIEDYKNKYSLNSDTEFYDHIERKVLRGVVA